MSRFEADEGLADPQAVLAAPFDATEVAKLFDDSSVAHDGELKLPDSLTRKVMRCTEGTVEELVKRDLISSGDVLAKLIPQIAGRAMSSRYDEADLRGLYLQVYRAFRARRSLLLLNLQRQVRFEDLPWVQKLESLSTPTYDSRTIAKRTLVDVAVLSLTSFPCAIVPNKLLQELRATELDFQNRALSGRRCNRLNATNEACIRHACFSL